MNYQNFLFSWLPSLLLLSALFLQDVVDHYSPQPPFFSNYQTRLVVYALPTSVHLVFRMTSEDQITKDFLSQLKFLKHFFILDLVKTLLTHACVRACASGVPFHLHFSTCIDIFNFDFQAFTSDWSFHFTCFAAWNFSAAVLHFRWWNSSDFCQKYNDIYTHNYICSIAM